MSAYTIEELRRDGIEPLMRWLLTAARHGSDLTYGEIAKRLEYELEIKGPVFSVHVGQVAGALQDALQAVDKAIPLINSLIVGKNGLPGAGINDYLSDRYGAFHSDTKRRLRLCTQARREVYEYANWQNIYRLTFHKSAPSPEPGDPEEIERDGKSPDGRRGGVPESTEHRKLKQYVCDNPRCLGLRKRATTAQVEYPLKSGDMVDVFLTSNDQYLLVEVKSKRSSEADLRRGIYQCVKYRAVMKAQQEAYSPVLKVISILVTEVSLRGDLQALAKRLRIPTKVVPVN